MQTIRLALVFAVLGGIVSCAGDMPVGPKATVMVTGIVLDRDGAPLNGAFITFLVDPEPSGTIFSYPLRTQTSADGTFQGEVPEGTYRVAIEPRFAQGFPDIEVPFTVRPGSSHFEHRYSGVWVSGTATGPDGVPVAEYSVRAFRTEGEFESIFTLAAGGTYRMLLRPGEHDFEGYTDFPPGLPRLDFSVDVPDQDTTINLDFGGHEVRVQVMLFGARVPGTYVSAQRLGVSNQMHTNLSGEAVFYLPSGVYELRVSTQTPGITGPERRSVDIQGDETIPVDLSGVWWTGTVLRSGDLVPVPHARVLAQEVGTQRQGYTSTDASGRFEMIVRPGVLHNLVIQPSNGGSIIVNGISSSADSTFDVPINIPVP